MKLICLPVAALAISIALIRRDVDRLHTLRFSCHIHVLTSVGCFYRCCTFYIYVGYLSIICNQLFDFDTSFLYLRWVVNAYSSLFFVLGV